MAPFWTHIYEVWNYVNADLIAEGLSPFKPESVAIESGKLLLKKIDDLVEKKNHFLLNQH